VSTVALAALPEPVLQTKPDTMPPLIPATGRPYNPVVTLNGWTLPWRMNQGVKEFHLIAEPVVRELCPGFKAMSSSSPAPMMTGQGPFGSVGMGGMFSMIKVRKDLKRGNYQDPGWFNHPPGTVAYEFKGTMPAHQDGAAQPAAASPGSMPRVTQGSDLEVRVRKPGGGGHGHH